MKKLFFLFAMLASVAASAQTLSIKITNIDYSTKIATCDISWTGRNDNHRSDVWVFADYIEISGSATTGAWQPAEITGATVTANTSGNATVATVAGNTRGVWIKSTAYGAAFTGKIVIQLSNVPAKFNACAYASDYPPNAASYSSGTYTLKGTQPFIITGNGTIQNGNKYVGTVINSMTDATGCPGGVGRDVVHNGGTCASGLTAVAGVCRDLAADEATVLTCAAVAGGELEVKLNDAGLVASYTNLCPAGWKLPTIATLKCMVPLATSLHLTLYPTAYGYLASETNSSAADHVCVASPSEIIVKINSNPCGCISNGTCPGGRSYALNVTTGTKVAVRCVR
jgi:hypothetical protein